MDTKVRKAIFTPLLEGNLSAIIPRLTVSCSTGDLVVPATLFSRDDEFIIELHLPQPDFPQEFRLEPRKECYTKEDCLKINGEINGEIPFVCDDIYPPSNRTTRSRGTSTVTLTSNCLQLASEGTDLQTFAEVSRLLGADRPDDECPAFSAHLIYHGPELLMPNTVSKTVSENDFIGSVTTSSFDTYQFEGDGYRGALIERDNQLHLHVLGEKLSCGTVTQDDATSIIDSIGHAVGFCFGFNPWPAYREVRVNHVIVERWITPRLNLPTTYLAPISGSLWYHLQSNPSDPIHKVIPSIADGFRNLKERQRQRLLNLLWHVRCTSSSSVPYSTRLLTICAVLDGMTKLVTDSEPTDKLSTNMTWKNANYALGLSWEKWTHSIFELWGKYRHKLSHGWLWIDEESKSNTFFTDYPVLGCAFHLMAARLCGYNGCVMRDPFKNKIINISDITEE